MMRNSASSLCVAFIFESLHFQIEMSLLILSRNALRPCYASILSTQNIGPVRMSNITLLKPTAVRCITSESSGMDPAVQKIAKTEKVEFWEKNRNLNRPVSPHMTIYSWQYTNSLSILHRATGIMIYGGLAVLAVPYLSMPYMFPAYIQYLTSFTGGKLLLGAGKFLISMPVIYHMLNGARHLFWDYGMGLSLETLRASGYAIVGTSVLLSLLLAFWRF